MSTAMDALAARILARLEEEAEAHAIDIVSVEVVGTMSAPTVRVRIDHADETAGTITLDEVTQETGWISELIDELDPVDSNFTLEVSSPGLSRPLRRAHDFERFAGSHVAIKTRASEGRRRFSGLLRGLEDGRVVIESDEGAAEELSFDLDEIASCTLKPDFELDKPKPGKKSNKKSGTTPK
ncbi:MAG: ribosome maturation factor RimP [Atopobiaceae bacterium]|jgi:ribosome maturation factor RimP